MEAQDQMLGSIPTSPVGGSGGSGPGPKAVERGCGEQAYPRLLSPPPWQTVEQTADPTTWQQSQHHWPQSPDPAGSSDEVDGGGGKASSAGPVPLAHCRP